MKIIHYTDVEPETVEEGAEGVSIRWIITERDGAPNFAMRHFEIAPGGHTPLHTHGWEHEVFILTGRGALVTDGGEKPFGPGTVIYLAPDERHQFRAGAEEPVTMLCLIPSPKRCGL